MKKQKVFDDDQQHSISSLSLTKPLLDGKDNQTDTNIDISDISISDVKGEKSLEKKKVQPSTMFQKHRFQQAESSSSDSQQNQRKSSQVIKSKGQDKSARDDHSSSSNSSSDQESQGIKEEDKEEEEEVEQDAEDEVIHGRITPTMQNEKGQDHNSPQFAPPPFVSNNQNERNRNKNEGIGESFNNIPQVFGQQKKPSKYVEQSIIKEENKEEVEYKKNKVFQPQQKDNIPRENRFQHQQQKGVDNDRSNISKKSSNNDVSKGKIFSNQQHLKKQKTYEQDEHVDSIEDEESEEIHRRSPQEKQKLRDRSHDRARDNKSHNRSRDRSNNRSRDKSRDRSRNVSRNKSRNRSSDYSDELVETSREHSRNRSQLKNRSKLRDKQYGQVQRRDSRESSDEKQRDRSRDIKKRDGYQDKKYKDQDRGDKRDRDRSREEQYRDQLREQTREKSRDRDRSYDRERPKERDRSRDISRDNSRNRDKSRDRSRDRNQDTSRHLNTSAFTQKRPRSNNNRQETHSRLHSPNNRSVDSSGSASDRNSRSRSGGNNNRRKRRRTRDEEREYRLAKKQKTEFHFDYTKDYKKNGPQEKQGIEQDEEGMLLEDIENVEAYFYVRDEKNSRKKRKIARQLGKKSMFYTSRWFLIYHLSQCVIFWIISIVFPNISIINCDQGHYWMSHVCFAIFAVLIYGTDAVFMWQYIGRELLKIELKTFKGETKKRRRCCSCCVPWMKSNWELFMTQLALLDIYTDICFLTIANQAGYTALFAVSVTSMVVTVLPKLYALVMIIILICPCYKDESKRRKIAFRCITINEFRVQAINVNLVKFEKRKTELIWACWKFLTQNLPQVIVQIIYLRTTPCGIYYDNTIVYLSIFIAVANTFFGFFMRGVSFLYRLKKLYLYEHKSVIIINNYDLMNYGFKMIRERLFRNPNVKYISVQGSEYEYMGLDDLKVQKLGKVIDQILIKEKVQFMEIKRIRTVKDDTVKILFNAVNKNLKQIKYITIQQCQFYPNSTIYIKKFLEYNTSLLRFTLSMNMLQEEDILEILSCVVEQPNIEVIQLVENVQDDSEKDNDKDNSDDRRRGGGGRNKKQVQVQQNKMALSKNIQIGLQQNESLRKIEIRFIRLNRQAVQSIFKAMGKNHALQKLVLTHDALENAGQNEYHILGEALQQNIGLRCLDLSKNKEFDNKVLFHNKYTDGYLKNDKSKLQKIVITSQNPNVQLLYLEVMDIKRTLKIICNDKILEDVAHYSYDDSEY